jgi:hypothetical protein
MLAAISIAIGYAALIGMFGWAGLAAIAVHVGIMLAAVPRR